jgi:hypothetical protein
MGIKSVLLFSVECFLVEEFSIGLLKESELGNSGSFLFYTGHLLLTKVL